jgi:hypothetical protein
LKEGTVTFGYSPVKNFELRAEFRYDRSAAGAPQFFKTLAARNAGIAGIPDSDNLSEFALQAVYKFSAPPPPPTPAS